MSNLRIGTSGWNYPTGRGTWNGIFYPAKTRVRSGVRRTPQRKFDELAYYADHFDTVEINTTFYGPPKPTVAQSWADRTPPGFEFSLKLYRQLTHPEVPGVPRLDQVVVDEYRRGVEPLAQAGKIGALLAQFPPSFKQTSESQAYLDALLGCFEDYQVAVELRHRSWSDNFSATLGLLNSRKAALTQIDEPKFKLSIRQNQLPNITGFYYMRLHGRNAAQWWRHDKSEDRYNYLYSADELKPIAETADAARRLVRKFYLYFNNHFSSKAVVNAVMIKSQLGEPIAGRYPLAFVERFPEIAPVVSTDLDPQSGDRIGRRPLTRAESWEAIRRGWSKHCPHCGRGPLFIGWNKPHRHCPACGYLYERDYGDVWWVWIVTDRIPIGIGIIFLYFGFRVTSWWIGLIFFGSLALPLLLTIPRRYGLAIAITYLIRKRWPDPKDRFPVPFC